MSHELLHSGFTLHPAAVVIGYVLSRVGWLDGWSVGWLATTRSQKFDNGPPAP